MGGVEERYCRRVPLRTATTLFDFAACVNAFYVTWDNRRSRIFRLTVPCWSCWTLTSSIRLFFGSGRG